MSLAKADKTTDSIPPLQPGDRLKQAEFERRYRGMPDCKKAELIEGIVYMPSPARLRHSQPHALLMSWIVQYAIHTPGTDYADNTTNRLDNNNQPQPDVTLFVLPNCGGQARFSEDDYLTGPPEFVAEVSVSSVSLDRGPKLRTYELHGVQDYLIWRVDDGILEWYTLTDEGFVCVPQPKDGIYRSRAFPGLWLHASAMLSRQGQDVMRILQQGLASPEHAEFVQKLKGKQR